MSPTLSFDTIIYEVDGHKATITLNRPDALNALSPHMITELRSAYDAAESDDDIWLTIVTATGRAFCTGADVKEIPPGDGKVVNERPYLSTYEQWEAPQEGTPPPFRTMTKPVIVAVNGICCGAGLDWVTTGDIIIASDRATFFDPHVSIGLVAAREMVRLARALPPRSVALRMALMGKHERMTVQRAYELAHHRDRRTRSPAGTRARDRRHAQSQCAARGPRNAAGHPQDPGPAAARGRDPRRDVPRTGHPHRGRTGGTAGVVEKRKPNWQAR